MKKLKCCGCKLYFDKDTLINLNGSNFHDMNCAVAYSTKKARKLKAKQIKRERKETGKALRDFNRKDLKWQHRLTQKAFNRMRVLEELKWFADKGLPARCISCQKILGGDQWCCGHFKTVGSASSLRYDKHNTYLQHNRSCNMALSGDIGGTVNTMGYKKGLIVRFGKHDGQQVIDYCESNGCVRRWEWQEVETMRKQFNSKIRELDR